MRFDGNGGVSPNMKTTALAVDAGRGLSRTRADHLRIGRSSHHLDQNDYYTQPGNLFRLMPADAKQRLISNIVGGMKGIPAAHSRTSDPALLPGRPRIWNRCGQGAGAEHREDRGLD